MKVALAGNPNSGKTTLFNALTGKVERVGNWAGVTISKKEGEVKKALNKSKSSITVVDLPGAYSMSPYTSEENITSDFIKNESPEVIINIVDATNLNRSLFFTTQLLELGIPVVVALNKIDMTRKQKNDLNVKILSEKLKCYVVETTATSISENGLEKLIETVQKVKGKEQVNPYQGIQVDSNIKSEVEAADIRRYAFVKEIVKKVEKKRLSSNKQTVQDEFDRIVAHKWFGILIFAAVMWVVFSLSQAVIGPFFADLLVGGIDSLYEMLDGLLGETLSPVLYTILLDGIVGGVGAVLGFLPLIMVLFFLLALLEDCGYMARVAVVMDPYFKKVGLSGKSIIPMIIGTGCAVPGIMATRTIKNERQRRTTAMLTPFMPCGAKLPVIALFAGVFFDNAAWVGTSMYFVGILFIILGAFVILHITGEKNAKSFFIMEIPEYRLPSIKSATLTMLSQGKAYIVKASTIILLSNTVVNLMQTFDWRFQMVAEGAENTSILASIATPFAIVLIPLGFGVWQLAAAAVTGFIAKENVVGTLAVVYSVTNFIDTEEFALLSGAENVASVMGLTSVAALAYLMFNLFTPPCFAAIGAMNAEVDNKKWLAGGILFQLGAGYVIAYFVYQIGTVITLGRLGNGCLPGLMGVIAMTGYVVYLMKKSNKKELALKKVA